ncbi:ATP-dependent RNA helicase-like protein chl1 [Delitschia confertaspora ATCC 74209]|uniref:ATP-dependent DNA helicase CHL1 n=1 Tax=Delitschia confertaspora ATCC 74209 TaxID=1513339 RepID=A0A9P4JTY2_9PLEO|nr:ATP-dependent RNA helicase-like protein chl1 [Delitschia confertaspora ATCC 74209]
MSDEKMERDFHHPYEPYEIQKQFMSAVYDCLESGKVGIFESPTGTGKTLSLICSSLTWLRDYKSRTFEDGFGEELANSEEPSWLIEHARLQKKEEALRRRRDLETRLAKIRAKEKRLKERYQNSEPRYKRQKTGGDQHGDDEDEARFILNDYESGEESNKNSRRTTFDDSGISAETQALMQQLGYSVHKKEDEEEPVDEMKIFFCSRTHSQLTQFSTELRRVKMPPAISLEPPGEKGTEKTDIDKAVEQVKHLTLGARKNLCINPKVKKLGSATAINEKCLEIQQPGTSTDRKCPFLPTKETETLVNDFRDHALAQIRDIEDLGLLGKKLGVCPYYASRPVTKYCEIVTLPYPLLLQKSAREALNLSLKNHVVIVDEAHNLMDAIAGIYSISVTLAQLQLARAQLTAYLQKFRNKLKGKNRVYVAQTVRLLDSVITCLQGKNVDSQCGDGLVDMSNLLSGKGVDQINLFKLNKYLQDSRLARKVDGYTTFVEQQQQNNSDNAATSKQASKHSVPVLTHVQGFLLSLMNPSKEGRFFYSKDELGFAELKYMLLDPTFHFKDIVEEARAVILAGGTMSPMSDYAQHLLSYLEPSRIMMLSCGHVIPPSQLLAIPVTHGSSGTEFEFTFEKRNLEKTMIDLANTLLTFIQHIPDGVVVFFPSYSYLDTCTAAWKRLRGTAASNPVSLWESLSTVKPIFLEQRSQAQPPNANAMPDQPQSPVADSVLTAYSSAVSCGGGRGALLFAVIGGTLSEGINFSDALGRGVAVVGLPFPNPHSAEWRAKMQYISSKIRNSGGDGKAAAREFYENACMRAVNQCVGRAIRHRADYAAILMVDRRYSGQRIQAKLPRWIRDSLTNGMGGGEVSWRLDEFFVGKV